MPDKADIDTLLDEMGVDDIEDVNGSVHADIGPRKKVRWMAYAAEHYRGNLTALIEEAVDKELNDNYVLASEDTASGDITAAPSEGLTDDLNEIKQQVTALSTQVDTLTSGDTDELDRNERIRLGNRIRYYEIYVCCRMQNRIVDH